MRLNGLLHSDDISAFKVSIHKTCLYYY